MRGCRSLKGYSGCIVVVPRRTIQYYLDEDLSSKIAVPARSLGRDIISAHEIGAWAYTDEAQLLLAAREGRGPVSKNDSDYKRITVEFQAQGLPHMGLLIVPKSIGGNEYARIAAALAYYATLYPMGMPPYMFDYLHPAPEETS